HQAAIPQSALCPRSLLLPTVACAPHSRHRTDRQRGSAGLLLRLIVQPEALRRNALFLRSQTSPARSADASLRIERTLQQIKLKGGSMWSDLEICVDISA